MTQRSSWSDRVGPAGRLDAGRGDHEIDEERRREIFRSLVELQDREPSVSKTRSQIARQYTLTERQLRRIEEEGIEKGWPPL
jgi:hypothetical protein